MKKQTKASLDSTVAVVHRTENHSRELHTKRIPEICSRASVSTDRHMHKERISRAKVLETMSVNSD